MPRSIAGSFDAEDTIRGLVKERERRRLYVIGAMIVAFVGFAIATTITYMNP
jgi:hypothetical protein